MVLVIGYANSTEKLGEESKGVLEFDIVVSFKSKFVRRSHGGGGGTGVLIGNELD